MKVWATIAKALQSHGRCVMVSVLSVEGSAPREAGARLVVVPAGFHGTIGGGTLEWRALAAAQAMLDGGPVVKITTHALGPDLGQCCGGRVTLLTEVFGRETLEVAQRLAMQEDMGEFVCESEIGKDKVVRHLVSEHPSSRRKPGPNSQGEDSQNFASHSDPSLGPGFRRDDDKSDEASAATAFTETFGQTLRPLYLFGAGHVGRALILALAPLPFAVTWIDPRPDAFPGAVPANVVPVRADDPVLQLQDAPAGSFALVMTHSHSLDLAIVDAALRHPRFAFVGLIGSATKRVRFAKRLREAGVEAARIASLACPIGIPGIGSKTPPVIAASAVAQILIRDEMLKTQSAPAAAPRNPVTMRAGRRS